MKKITLLFSAVLLITLSFYSCEQSQLDPTDPESADFVETKPLNKIDMPEKIRYCGEEEVCLWAGQDIDAGKVIIGNDDENLYITVYSEEGFQDASENVKIDVVTTLPDSRPPAGHFPYKATVPSGEKIATFQIPLTDFGIDPKEECMSTRFYVLVHADVIANGKGETAWGGCEEGPRKTNPNGKEVGAWWFYSEYYTQCCECWCGFGNDYQSPEDDACLSMMFEGERYIFWSNRFKFKEFAGENKNYEVSLLVNPTDCTPQDTKGNIIELLATDVGTVELSTYTAMGDDGKSHPYVDVKYNLYEKYKGYNIQLDFYLGIDKIPKVDRDLMKMITDDDHMLYQHKLTPGETTYTFTKIPWVENKEGDTFIALHAAIGDCPMPSLQNPM